jgi:mono/diheme cytochrome c family protein
MRRANILALALALAACAHAGGEGAPRDGAALYRRKCTSCHRLIPPPEKDAATWRGAIERFGTRLSPEERAAVTEYLVSNARDAAAP